MNKPYRVVEDAPGISPAGPVPLSNTLWASPDPSVLRSGRGAPPDFPFDVLGPWKTWVTEAAEGANAPADYVAGALLAATAALIGNSRSVSPWTSWTEPAVLWVGLVGDPSSHKSPALDTVMKALRKAERDLGSDFDALHLDWQTKEEMAKAIEKEWKLKVDTAAKNDKPPPPKPRDAVVPDEPMLPRIIVSDVTAEALARLLVANPKGVLHYRDELSGWLASFDRYNSGDSRGLWVEAYGARPYVIDRKISGTLRIPQLAVSVTGGIQPDKLKDILTGTDDGLASRFFWLWPEQVAVRRPHSFADDCVIDDAFERLSELQAENEGAEGENPQPRPRILSLATPAKDIFQAWREKHQDELRGVSGARGSAWGKMPGLVLRLALILEYSWWARGSEHEPAEISQRVVENAILMMDSYIKPMTERVYGDAALPAAERHANALGRWLIANRTTQFNARELRRRAGGPTGLRDVETMHEATATLIDANWIRASKTDDGQGRKPKNFEVNPGIMQLKP